MDTYGPDPRQQAQQRDNAVRRECRPSWYVAGHLRNGHNEKSLAGIARKLVARTALIRFAGEQRPNPPHGHAAVFAQSLLSLNLEIVLAVPLRY